MASAAGFFLVMSSVSQAAVRGRAILGNILNAYYWRHGPLRPRHSDSSNLSENLCENQANESMSVSELQRVSAQERGQKGLVSLSWSRYLRGEN